MSITSKIIRNNFIKHRTFTLTQTYVIRNVKVINNKRPLKMPLCH
jgi:hypothetical protein